jgi:hypothetical protein
MEGLSHIPIGWKSRQQNPALPLGSAWLRTSYADLSTSSTFFKPLLRLRTIRLKITSLAVRPKAPKNAFSALTSYCNGPNFEKLAMTDDMPL